MKQWGSRFAINTYSYTQSMSALECVRHLAATGVKCAELMFFPGHLWIGDSQTMLRQLRCEIEFTGIQLATVNTPNVDLNIAAATSEMREYSLRINLEYLRIAGELGARALILGPGKPNPLFPLSREKMETHFFHALDRLLSEAGKLSVEVWVENMPFAFLPESGELMASLARYGHDDIGVVYDVANAHFVNEDLLTGFECVASRLRLVHLSDTTRMTYRHDAVGLGDVDFASVMQKISSLDLDYAPMLEIISRDPDEDIPRSIDALTAIS